METVKPQQAIQSAVAHDMSRCQLTGTHIGRAQVKHSDPELPAEHCDTLITASRTKYIDPVEAEPSQSLYRHVRTPHFIRQAQHQAVLITSLSLESDSYRVTTRQICNTCRTFAVKVDSNQRCLCSNNSNGDCHTLTQTMCEKAHTMSSSLRPLTVLTMARQSQWEGQACTMNSATWIGDRMRCTSTQLNCNTDRCSNLRFSCTQHQCMSGHLSVQPCMSDHTSAKPCKSGHASAYACQVTTDSKQSQLCSTCILIRTSRPICLPAPCCRNRPVQG